MLTASQGRLLVFALIVHFALLLPVADIAHGVAHPDETGCEVCAQLGALQNGLVAAVTPIATPVPAASAAVPGPGAVPRTLLTSATARGPPANW